MTHSPSDSLVFRLAEGEAIPCAEGAISLKLFGEEVSAADSEVIEHAAAAVLHYFREDLGRTEVSVNEFSSALEKALRSVGMDIQWAAPSAPPTPVSSDLTEMARQADGFELVFFQRLRDEVRRNLESAPALLQFAGLRGCVQHLTGARRWTGRCQELHDQIVGFLRQCVTSERPGQPCGLIIR